LIDEAPKSGLVGLAHRAEGEVGVITVVGDAASQAMVAAEGALNSSDIDATIADAGDRFARIEISAQRIEDAVRSVHQELFRMEAAS
jgi:hypothetical protein